MAEHFDSSEETSAMLVDSQKSARVVSVPEANLQNTHRKESLRDFLRGLGSIKSLPGQEGKPFSNRRGIINQCYAALAVFIMTAAGGQPMGFSAVLLPQLEIENSTMQIDIEMGSWIASIHSTATPFGSFLAGPMMERVGRLRTLQVSVVPLVIGWVVLATAPSLAVLFVGRVLCGYAVGTLAVTSQVYLGEISDPKLRGFLSGAPIFNFSLGILIIYSLGQLPWRWVAGSGVILPIVALLLLLRMPQTPDWLARRGQLSKAHSALLWLRGDETLAKKEIHQMMTACVTERDEQNRTKNTFFKLIRKPSVLKPLVIINVINLFEIFSGTFMVVFYAVDIIKEVVGEKAKIDNTVAAILTAVIRLVFCFIGCILLYYLNRRTLSMISGIGSTVAAFALGIYMLFRIGRDYSTVDVWITSGCLITYVALNTMGFMILPGLMVGELLPAKVRGICGGCIYTILNVSMFWTTKLYPTMKSGIGTHGMFMIFGSASLLGTVFMFLFLPETKDRSLIEIEQYFKKSNVLWMNRNVVASETPR